MAQEKEYGLLIAAIVAIVSIVGLVILFSRGNVTSGNLIVIPDPSFCGGPGWVFIADEKYTDNSGLGYGELEGYCIPDKVEKAEMPKKFKYIPIQNRKIPAVDTLPFTLQISTIIPTNGGPKGPNSAKIQDPANS